MSEIPRYTREGFADDTMELDDDGLWVRWSDAEEILREREKLRSEQREAVAIDIEAGRLPLDQTAAPLDYEGRAHRWGCQCGRCREGEAL
jgi:hypothetical protein